MPSATSTRAIASAGGIRRPTTRQRERMVTITSSGWVDGAHSRKTVRSGGSSIALSRAFAAPSVSRSASSITTTCQRPSIGRRAARPTTARISPTPMDSPSGTTQRTSGWLPASTERQDEQCPQPGSAAARSASPPVRPGSALSHSKAQASARAATERPEPAGPVNSQACVIAAGRHRPAGHHLGTRAGGPGQLGHRRVLPDQRVEDGHETVPIASRRCTSAAIAAASSATGRVASRTRYRSGSWRASWRKPARTRSWNASCSRSSRSGPVSQVRSPARARPMLRVDVQQHGEIRQQASGRPLRQRRDLGRRERPAGALVGDRGVDVAVAQHVLAGRELRPDLGLDVVRPVGGEQQRLAARRDLLVGLQQQ